jgi:FO synthase
VLQHADSSGLARDDSWAAGNSSSGTSARQRPEKTGSKWAATSIRALTAKAADGATLTEPEIVALFNARGEDFEHICTAADALRREVSGDRITYVVNRNINYTNMCTYRCRFCAFSKGKGHNSLRGDPYLLDLDEIGRRTREAWDRGGTEVCLQGGIHPTFTGETYLDICRAVKAAAPDIHVHAFSPLEISHGATTLGISVRRFLDLLQEAGLGTLPGTAAEILDKPVRDLLCADKINSEEWLEIISTAHEQGLRTTSTIMFGHLETPASWARHLLKLRTLQKRTGGITEFVPLPFVHMEAPMYLKGEARPGPTRREVTLMHAVSRLALHPHIASIQVSWVKLGQQVSADCLRAGANDLGGTLMNESISRAAGADYGQEMPPAAMDRLIHSINRKPHQRTTLYADANPAQTEKSYLAKPLLPVTNRPARELKRAS